MGCSNGGTAANGGLWARTRPATGGGVVFGAGVFVLWGNSAGTVEVGAGDGWQAVALPQPSGYFLGDLRVVDGTFRGMTDYNCCFGEIPGTARWGTLSSSDGLTWTAGAQDLTSPPPMPFLSAAGRCVAFAAGNVLAGPDCDHLTVRYSDSAFGAADGVYAGGTFVVVGSGGILISGDAMTWTKAL
jgi:hypothetical protein